MPAHEGYFESEEDRSFKKFLKNGPTGPKELRFKSFVKGEEIEVKFNLPPRENALLVRMNKEPKIK